jgi:chromosome segregation ATPase
MTVNNDDTTPAFTDLDLLYAHNITLLNTLSAQLDATIREINNVNATISTQLDNVAARLTALSEQRRALEEKQDQLGRSRSATMSKAKLGEQIAELAAQIEALELRAVDLKQRQQKCDTFHTEVMHQLDFVTQKDAALT